VIRTANALALNAPVIERDAPVGAAQIHQDDVAVLRPIEQEFFAQNLGALRLCPDELRTSTACQ